MQRDGYDSYEVLQSKNVAVIEIAQWHIGRVVKAINRKFTIKQTFHTPFSFRVAEPIKATVFHQIFVAIKEYRAGSGKSQPKVNIKTVQDKPGRHGTVTNQYILTFSSYFSVIHFFTHILKGEEVLPHFTKKIRNCEVKLEVNEAKPFTISFKRKQDIMCITGSFQVKNEFGTVCSF